MMDEHDRSNIDPDLASLGARLWEERATASPLEMDRIKLRAISQARRPRSGSSIHQKGTFMKSRFTIIAMIVFGLMMGTTGATVAITGTSGSGDAAQSQYKSGSDGDLAGEGTGSDSKDPVPSAAEQVSATGGSDTLPFTGFAAIPLLILGVASLSAGLLLRRQSKDDPSG